jgi:hypothetical protein
MAPKLRFHEGKACDAVIRRIEAREQALRCNLRWPKQDGHAAPIELTCQIGGQLFAIEHTGIEPFAGHLRLEADAEKHFKPIEAMLAGALPATEHIELHIPLKATNGMKGAAIRRIQQMLVAWIGTTAPTLPVARLGRYVTPITPVSLPGVPFSVSLHRCETGGFPGRFSIRHMVEGDLESDRVARVHEAYRRKCPKLAAWRRDQGARTVLILEENDIQLTNAQVVADAVLEVEKARTDSPDEVYLVSTAIDNPWWIWAIRVDGRDYYQFSRARSCLTEVDPGTLTDITRRQRPTL